MSDFISKSRLKWEIEKWYEKEYYSSFNSAVYNALLKIIDKFPSVEQEKCGDCISRQAAIDAINHVVIKFPRLLTNKQKKIVIETINLTKNAIENALIKFPSVEPERKQGHWEWDQRTGEYVCSECGCNPIYERTTPDCSEIDKYKFCRWCGAKMMDEQTLKYADTDTAFGGLQSAT